MSDAVTQIPPKIKKGKQVLSTMHFLWHSHTTYKALAVGEVMPDKAPAERYACGFPLPPFQRPHCWSLAQEEAFIESVWLDLPIGSFTLQRPDWDADDQLLPQSGWLIDGQQRLTTIERYWEDCFPVFGRLYSELSQVEQRRFLNTGFSHFETALSSEDELRELYDRLAFGGTAHRSDQRASGRIDPTGQFAPDIMSGFVDMTDSWL